MSMPTGITISDDCITAYKALHYGRGHDKPKFIIFKISDDESTVLVDETSSEPDYEVFSQKLRSSIDSSTGKPEPRFAVYDVEYDLGEDGKRDKTVFISWVPTNTALKSCMLYATTKEQLKSALDVKLSIHADTVDEIEWRRVVHVASGGRV